MLVLTCQCLDNLQKDKHLKIVYKSFGEKQNLTMTFEASDGNEELW